MSRYPFLFFYAAQDGLYGPISLYLSRPPLEELHEIYNILTAVKKIDESNMFVRYLLKKWYKFCIMYDMLEYNIILKWDRIAYNCFVNQCDRIHHTSNCLRCVGKWTVLLASWCGWLRAKTCQFGNALGSWQLILACV